jgi:hypothetical protein
VATVELYDPDRDRWDPPQPDMPAHVEMATAVAASNGKIYVMGGRVPCLGDSGIVLQYDPGTKSWSTQTPLQRARSFLAGITSFIASSAAGSTLYEVISPGCSANAISIPCLQAIQARY